MVSFSLYLLLTISPGNVHKFLVDSGFPTRPACEQAGRQFQNGSGPYRGQAGTGSTNTRMVCEVEVR